MSAKKRCEEKEFLGKRGKQNDRFYWQEEPRVVKRRKVGHIVAKSIRNPKWIEVEILEK